MARESIGDRGERMPKSMNTHEVITAVCRFFRPSICALAIGLLASCTVQQLANQPLQLVNGSAPIYPAALKAESIGGQVTVQYDVTAQGRVVNARVVASEPLGLFDAAALQAVGSWRFKPQVREGDVEAVLGITSTLEFRAPK